MQLKIGLVFPECAGEAILVIFAHGGSHVVAATNKLMAGDFIHVQLRYILGNVVGSDVVGRQLRGIAVEKMLRETCTEICGHITNIYHKD